MLTRSDVLRRVAAGPPGRSNRLLALRSQHRLRAGEGDSVDDDRQLQVSRIIDAPPERIFAVLADPARHRELDGAGMLHGLDSGDAPVTAAGQAFVMNMNQDGRSWSTKLTAGSAGPPPF